MQSVVRVMARPQVQWRAGDGQLGSQGAEGLVQVQSVGGLRCRPPAPRTPR